MRFHFEKYYPAFMQHIQRHFEGSGVAGSVFTSNRFNTPKKVVDSAYEKIKHRYRGERLVLAVDCKEEVGLEGIVALEEIPLGVTITRERRIKKEKGNNRKPSYTVLVAYGIKRKPTTKMVIIAEPVKDRDNLHAFSSIYPGRYAPDFDDAEFWSNHAFVKEKRL